MITNVEKKWWRLVTWWHSADASTSWRTTGISDSSLNFRAEREVRPRWAYTDINPSSREEFRRSTFQKKFGVTQSYARERRYIPGTSQTREDPVESRRKGILLFRFKKIFEWANRLGTPVWAAKIVALYNATLTGNLLARCTTRRWYPRIRSQR